MQCCQCIYVFCIGAVVFVQYMLSGSILDRTGAKMAENKFVEHEVVPNIVKTAPATVMKVSYRSGVEVNLGNDLTPRQVKDEPNVTWEADESALYTLVMTDPDAPNRTNPIMGEIKHWLVVNIPGNRVSEGDVLAEYVGSGPSKGSGKHRYIFMAYKQHRNFTEEEQAANTITEAQTRRKFNLQAFSEKYHLGNPVAGNFYQAEWDEYVTERNKERDRKLVKQKFEQHEVVPDVLTTPPEALLQVKYAAGIVVNLGDELTPRQVKDQPEVSWTADAIKLYTLCMTDPDAPSRIEPIRGEIKHWLVVNIPGTNITQGKVLAEYIGSGPRIGSGLHRYVFVVYKQLGNITADEAVINKHTSTGRAQFKIQQFAEQYGLGDPLAGNFYQAQYDDYVPELHKHLTQ